MTPCISVPRGNNHYSNKRQNISVLDPKKKGQSSHGSNHPMGTKHTLNVSNELKLACQTLK